jgi:Divergent InlB B-repeat domain/PASTA domain
VRRGSLSVLLAFTAVAVFVVLVARVPTAAAAPSVNCTGMNPGPSGVLDVVVSGTSSNTDSLTVSESGGDYSLLLNSGGSTAVCAGTTYPDSGASGFPTVEVTGSTLLATEFQASGDDGLTFEGQTGVANTLDLAALPGPGVTVSVAAGTVSWSTKQNSFSGISIIDGSNSGGTTFEANGTGGYTFAGGGSGGNVLDLSSAPAGIEFSLPDGQVYNLTTGTDSFSNIQTFDGSTGGGTFFVAGASDGDTFNGAGDGNYFIAGSGSATFNGGGGSKNTLDLSTVATTQNTPLLVNVSGTTVGGTADNTATVGSTTYTFSGIPTFWGPQAGNTHFVPSGTTGGYTIDFAGSGNTLDLSSWPFYGPGTVVSVSDGVAMQGLSLVDFFVGSATIDGSSAGNTIFFTGSQGGYTFNGSGPNNSLGLNAAGSGVTASVPDGTVTGLTGGSDNFSGISDFYGADAGGTHFIASGTTGGYTFDAGTGSGDTLDLSLLPASGTTVSVPDGTVNWEQFQDRFSGITTFDGSTSGNTIFETNSTGGYTFTGQGSYNFLDLTAAGPNVTVSAQDGKATLASGSDDFSGISVFIGSSSGSTDFIASGTTGGEQFAGKGSGNTLDLSAIPATTMPGGRTLVSVTGGGAGGVSSIVHPDSFTGITNFIGSATGNTTFFTESGGFTFTGGGTSGNDLDIGADVGSTTISVPAGKVTGLPGGSDEFSNIQRFDGSTLGGTTFVAGSEDGDTFASGGDGNLFIAGSGSDMFINGGGTATLDFSGVATSQDLPLTVDLSGGPAAINTATVGTTTYSIWKVTSFRGSQSGNTHFVLSDTGGFELDGGGTGNVLDLSDAPGATVTVNGDSLADPGIVSGLTNFDDSFSDIQSFPGAGTVLYRLSVGKLGGGAGSVTSSPTGIDCGSTCSHNYASGTSVTLTATPAAGSQFAGWSGACTGTGKCTVPMNATTAVTATFTVVPSYTLTVTKSGNGTGTVTSSPTGIDCGSICSHNFGSGTSVTLTPVPAAGSMFAGWSGACTGTGACSVPMSATKAVSAAFSLEPAYALTVAKSGKGKGTVTSSPAGIVCGSTCSYSFTSGTNVTLNAVAAAGSTFGGWHGACEGDQPCNFTITAPGSVTAIFLPDCVVPNVKGRNLSTARRLLKAHFCLAGKIEHTYSNRVKKGRVIGEKPKAGRELQPRATVSLVVSKGRHRRRK